MTNRMITFRGPSLITVSKGGFQSCWSCCHRPPAVLTSNDLRRTEYLKALGYRVLRFWNHEVLGDPDAVLESIRAALVEIPPPLYVLFFGNR